MVQKWKPIFFHIQCEKIFDGTSPDPSWTKRGPRRVLQFSLLSRLGAILDRFQFFWAALWAPLGAVRVRSGCPRRPPRSTLAAIFVLHLYLECFKYVIIQKWKNSRFMLVKRTILKIHLLSLCTLGPILSTLSSSEHRQQGQSMQNHLGNALCHILDPLRNIFFRSWSAPRPIFNFLNPSKRPKIFC